MAPPAFAVGFDECAKPVRSGQPARYTPPIACLRVAGKLARASQAREGVVLVMVPGSVAGARTVRCTCRGRSRNARRYRSSRACRRNPRISCFKTFPFPDPTPDQRERVGEAARRLVELGDGWLNPPGLDPADLARRTLTNLYSARPAWLANAHADLDTAVLAAYAWPADTADTAILGRLLALNLARSGGSPD